MAGQKYQPKNVTARVYSIVSGVKEMQRVPTEDSSISLLVKV